MHKMALGIISSTVLLSSAAIAESRLSGEVMAGIAEQELSGFGQSISADNTSIGLRLGYALNTNITAELSYQNYGEAEKSYIDSFGDNIHDTIESDALMIGLKGLLPLNAGFAVVGRLGISKWDVSVTETDSSFPGQLFKADDDGTDLYYGIGLEFQINEQVFSSFEYTITEMDTKFDVENEVSNIAISIGMKF